MEFSEEDYEYLTSSKKKKLNDGLEMEKLFKTLAKITAPKSDKKSYFKKGSKGKKVHFSGRLSNNYSQSCIVKMTYGTTKEAHKNFFRSYMVQENKNEVTEKPKYFDAVYDEVPESELKIISKLNGIYNLKKLVNDLNLKRNVKFEGYKMNPAIYFKNASLHFFPTLCESFGLVLSEAKLYGLPSILMGLNYVSLSNGGTVIIYDDKPESLAKVAIKKLKNKTYRKKLGKQARKSIKYYDNQYLLIKWIKLILSIYKGESHYEILRKQYKGISQKESLEILKVQVNLLRMRMPKIFNNITTELFENLTYMENLNAIKIKK